MTDLRTAAQQAHDRAKWINDEQAIVSYEDMMDLRNALGQPSPVFQDHSIPLGRRTQEQPIQPTAWLTDRQTMYFDKEDARRDCDGFIQPLYTHPAEPEPPPEPISDAKIRAEFRDLDRYRIPGDEMTLEDWFEAGVRFAEKERGVPPP
jgi:hypothetical protein